MARKRNLISYFWRKEGRHAVISLHNKLWMVSSLMIKSGVLLDWEETNLPVVAFSSLFEALPPQDLHHIASQDLYLTLQNPLSTKCFLETVAIEVKSTLLNLPERHYLSKEPWNTKLSFFPILASLPLQTASRNFENRSNLNKPHWYIVT